MPQAREWLGVAVEEAKHGLAEGGVPIGAALVRRDGEILGRGRNRRVQDADPSAHAEVSAFRAGGRQRSYENTVMVTTLAPCWYCAGLIRQFGIGTVVIGESRTFPGGGIDELEALGVEIVDLNDEECVKLMRAFQDEHPEIWSEDIGR